MKRFPTKHLIRQMSLLISANGSAWSHEHVIVPEPLFIDSRSSNNILVQKKKILFFPFDV